MHYVRTLCDKYFSLSQNGFSFLWKGQDIAWNIVIFQWTAYCRDLQQPVPLDSACLKP